MKHDDRKFVVAEAFSDLVDREQQLTLRAYRHRENLTQQPLVERAGLPPQHISEMENGKRTMARGQAKRLATALNCNYRRLL